MSEKIQKDEKTSVIMVRREITTTEDDLVTQFQERLFQFRRHIFNIKRQFEAYRELRRNLKSDECLLHVDFRKIILANTIRKFRLYILEDHISKQVSTLEYFTLQESSHHTASAPYHPPGDTTLLQSGPT